MYTVQKYIFWEVSLSLLFRSSLRARESQVNAFLGQSHVLHTFVNSLLICDHVDDLLVVVGPWDQKQSVGQLVQYLALPSREPWVYFPQHLVIIKMIIKCLLLYTGWSMMTVIKLFTDCSSQPGLYFGNIVYYFSLNWDKFMPKIGLSNTILKVL